MIGQVILGRGGGGFNIILSIIMNYNLVTIKSCTVGASS